MQQLKQALPARTTEVASAAETILQGKSEQIRYDAIADVLVEVGQMAEKWSENQ